MLTPRQAEIAELVSRGMSNKAIAKEAGISVRTVKKHIGDAARRIPGEDVSPRYKVLVWFFSVDDQAA